MIEIFFICIISIYKMFNGVFGKNVNNLNFMRKICEYLLEGIKICNYNGVFVFRYLLFVYIFIFEKKI